MKIKSVTAHVCNAEMRNWVFVRVETDEPGLIGWGEATLEFKTRAVIGAIADIEPMLVGQDPRNIEHCFQIMTKHGFWRMGIIGMSAISGIELALWDILGKHLGAPVWQLLGGSVRESLRTYTHLGLGDMRAVYESSSSAAIVEHARRVTQAGYDALKVVCIPYSHYVSPTADVDRVGRMVGDLRDAVGPGIDIMVDFHGRPASVNAAMDYINAIADQRVMFVEEPVPPEDVAGLAEITRRSPVPIASGERLVGRREFEPSLRARAFNIAQPDICHTGGLSESKKIAAMAETAGIGLAPHNPLGPIAGVAALHFGISTHNVIIQEEMSGAVPWYGEVVCWPIERRPGRWDKPMKPGLGIEVDEAVIDAHPFQPDILHARSAVMPDGTVVDW
ncbi:galactonate dehydratase [Mesorhizobium sp. M00.F.Ca.ET.216.01.1.1]|uniref:galactonate dehydratase n=1 Tax=Mesorhizobium sp. M00.F.Ca.ET.216.01.1.1 TaxID=2500528 RepID=UPI000FD7A12E|nr:galactonate dehydratase [Mesorhizobium sp. M00.F.Ca.ET.216.01.1.1]TGQ37232.1 galactonate dehydratase [Mesorhizobium sp. M00.F.Ca.ET.216.01.1.1]TJW37058.1 MAG: galactonate dehydratase [Mesorhizobium sp.]